MRTVTFCFSWQHPCILMLDPRIVGYSFSCRPTTLNGLIGTHHYIYIGGGGGALTLSSLTLQCHLHPLQAANCCREFVVDEDYLK